MRSVFFDSCSIDLLSCGGTKQCVQQVCQLFSITRTGRAVKLVLDVEESARAEVCKAAQVIWMEHWGPCRASGNTRSNFSKKRSQPVKKSGGKLTETEFIRKRRLDVKSNTEGLPAKRRKLVLEAAAAASAETWGAPQQAKEDALLKLGARMKAQAPMGVNVLAKQEIADVADLTEIERKARAKNDHDHDLKVARVKKALQPRINSRDLQKMPVWFSPSLEQASVDACRGKLASLDLLKGNDDRHTAVVFVVPDVGALGYHTSIVLGLCG